MSCTALRMRVISTPAAVSISTSRYEGNEPGSQESQHLPHEESNFSTSRSHRRCETLRLITADATDGELYFELPRLGGGSFEVAALNGQTLWKGSVSQGDGHEIPAAFGEYFGFDAGVRSKRCVVNRLCEIDAERLVVGCTKLLS